MDQRTGNVDGERTFPSVFHETSAEQANAPNDENADANTTPELEETNVGLPALKYGLEVDGERKVIRMEIPDSEEVSEFSSPVKVDGEMPAAEVQSEGGLETVDAVSEQVGEEGNTIDGGKTVMRTEILDTEEPYDFSSPVKVDRVDWQSHEGVVQGQVTEEILDAQSADIPSNAGNSTFLEEEKLSADAVDRVAVNETTPEKADDAELIKSPARTDGSKERSMVASAVDAGEIAVPAQKLLDEISPSTITKISDTIAKPTLLKTTTLSAIPDSDEDEDDELPDAPGPDEDDQPVSNASSAQEAPLQPATSPMIMHNSISKVAGIPSSIPQLRLAEQRQGKELGMSPTSSEESSHEPETLASDKITSSPAAPVNALLLENKDTASSHTSIGNSVQATLVTEPPSSLSQAEATNGSLASSSEQPTAQVHGLSQQEQEISRPTDTLSSPLQASSYSSSSFGNKISNSPSASFIAPEVSQNKDALKAELKAMKMASIQTRNAALEAEIASKRTKLEEVTKVLKQPAAETVKRHIKLLHDYNDMKDIGQGLIGMIADNRGVRIGELYPEFNIDQKD